jgi:hypothetical protein
MKTNTANLTERDVLTAASCVVIAETDAIRAEAAEYFRDVAQAIWGVPVVCPILGATRLVRYHAGLTYPCTFDPATLEADTLTAARLFLDRATAVVL